MAIWNSSALWSNANLWGPFSTGSTAQNTHKRKKHTVKRKYYYPGDSAFRPEWHANFAAKLLQYGATLTLPAGEMNVGIADNLYLAYALGEWITNVREYAPACTSALDTLARGTGAEAFVFLVCVAPALPTLPVGITEVLPGALDRTFRLVKLIKTRPGYTEAIGLDMGIVGSELPPPPPGDVPPPRITVTVIAGDTHQKGRLKFIKDGHEYVAFESRRGGGAWEPIGMTNKSPFIDDRPLLVPGQAEVREYRARFFDNNQPNGEWCAVQKVTISP